MKSNPFFRARPMYTADGGKPSGDAPVTPSRGHLNQVSVLYFPGRGQSLDLSGLMSKLPGSGLFDIDGATVDEGHPDHDDLQAAFEIRDRPALVICGHFHGALSTALADGEDRPGYCLIDDEAVLQDEPRLSGLVENLATLLAASSKGEVQSTLRTHRFRKLVWTASSRSGTAIDYITDLRVTFGVGRTRIPFSFDADGWATEAPAPEIGGNGAELRSVQVPLNGAGGLDSWNDDGGAQQALVTAFQGEAGATKVSARPRRIVGGRAISHGKEWSNHADR